MASAGLRKELECSVCLSLYTDPVILRCGHNFCKECISRVLDSQEKSGIYSCPECREEFLKRPPFQRNLALRNIVENFQASRSDETEVFCTYCIHSSVPAVKSCLLCEASLCQDHLKVHSKSPEHVLSGPTTSMDDRKCLIHKKVLEYYCIKDSICICSSCKLGAHQGHHMEVLHKAAEEKKKKLRNVLQKLKTMEEKISKRCQHLQKQHDKIKEQEANETERVSAQFRDIRRQLEDLEKRILREISLQAERLSNSDIIRQLEIKKSELSGKLLEIEGLCDVTDPLTVLQKSDFSDLCNIQEEGNMERERYDKTPQEVGDLDVTWVSQTFSNGISDILTGVNRGIDAPKLTEILLEEDTANYYLEISDDRKMVTHMSTHQGQFKSRRRFQDEPQVLSSQTFSSGQHFWEVDVGRSNNWIVGVCYPSVPKKGDKSIIGTNWKSWGMDRRGKKFLVRHNDEEILLPVLSSDRVGIHLNYESGQISFHELCKPIRLLYTFTTTFTEPLHAAFFVNHGWITVS